MNQYEALVRVSDPNPKALASGKSKYDVVAVKPLGSVWSEAERKGNFRVVVITAENGDDARVAALLDVMAAAKVQGVCIGLPYRDEAVQSTLRIDLSTVDARKLDGRVLKPSDGYTRKLAGLREISNG